MGWVPTEQMVSDDSPRHLCVRDVRVSTDVPPTPWFVWPMWAASPRGRGCAAQRGEGPSRPLSVWALRQPRGCGGNGLVSLALRWSHRVLDVVSAASLLGGRAGCGEHAARRARPGRCGASRRRRVLRAVRRCSGCGYTRGVPPPSYTGWRGALRAPHLDDSFRVHPWFAAVGGPCLRGIGLGS